MIDIRDHGGSYGGGKLRKGSNLHMADMKYPYPKIMHFEASSKSITDYRYSISPKIISGDYAFGLITVPIATPVVESVAWNIKTGKKELTTTTTSQSVSTLRNASEIIFYDHATGDVVAYDGIYAKGVCHAVRNENNYNIVTKIASVGIAPIGKDIDGSYYILNYLNSSTLQVLRYVPSTKSLSVYCNLPSQLSITGANFTNSVRVRNGVFSCVYIDNSISSRRRLVFDINGVISDVIDSAFTSHISYAHQITSTGNIIVMMGTNLILCDSRYVPIRTLSAVSGFNGYNYSSTMDNAGPISGVYIHHIDIKRKVGIVRLTTNNDYIHFALICNLDIDGMPLFSQDILYGLHVQNLSDSSNLVLKSEISGMIINRPSEYPCLMIEFGAHTSSSPTYSKGIISTIHSL